MFVQDSVISINCVYEPHGIVGVSLRFADITIPARSEVVIQTDVRIKPDQRYRVLTSECNLRSRNVLVKAGLLEPSFYGDLQIIVSNQNNANFTIEEDQIFARILPIDFNYSELHSLLRASLGE